MNLPRPHRLLNWWVNRGAAPEDSDDLRLKKAVMTIISSSIATLAIFWGSLYSYPGYPQSGAIPLGYAVASFSSTLYFFHTKRFSFFCFSQQLLILLLPFLLMWSLGGFANGSVVLIWAFFAPLAALFFIDLRAAGRWFAAFLLLLVVSALLDSHFAAMARPMPAWLNTLYFAMNLGLGFVLISLVLYYFVKDREQAYLKLKQSQDDIRKLMLTDALTGTPNRRHLDERLTEEVYRARRYGTSLCVILTDVDHFKAVNDNYGHVTGDEVLKQFARVLSDCVRDSDFLARFGGEEFVILLPGTERGTAQAIAERIRRHVKQLRAHGLTEQVSASFGVIQVRDGETTEQILQRVDAAMYQAKHAGRDRVVAV